MLFGAIIALVLSSVFKTILAGLILSYVFYPVYRWVFTRTRMKTTSALLVTLFIFLMLILPTIFLGLRLWKEAPEASVKINQYVNSLGDVDPKLEAVITNTIGKGVDNFFNQVPKWALAFPAISLHLFIVFFLMYYLFKDGEGLIDNIKRSLPLKKQRQDALIAQFGQVTYAVIYGTVVIAIIQGILAGIGFYLFGIPSPVIWGLVTFVASLIPLLGPFVVWLPASALLMLTGYYSGDNIVLLRGVGLFLYGLLLVSGIDNIIKPKIIGRKANIHPALVFLGIIGGVNFFGIVGIIVGPVIMAMFKTALETYIQEKDESPQA